MSEPIKEGGLLGSTGRLLATVFEIAQVRLELAGTEIELEKRRIFDGLLWGAVAVLALGVALVLMCGFIILLFWEGYRLAAVGTLSLLLIAVSLASMREARRRLRSPAGMFSASLAELERDRVGLQATGQYGQR